MEVSTAEVATLAEPDTLALTDAELATVLAALRFWQIRAGVATRTTFHHFDDVEPLDNEEIDTLCERLNCG